MDEGREQPWNFHTCKFCSYRSKSAFEMCKHVRLHGTELKTDIFTCDSKTLETFECEICVFGSNLKVDLTEHIRVFHEEKEVNDEQENILKCYCCKRCNFETHSLLVLAKHDDNCNILVRRKSSEGREYNKLLPVQIDIRFRQKFSPKSHIVQKCIQSEDINWFKCTYCNYKCKQKGTLKEHITFNHARCHNYTDSENGSWFKCTFCDYKCTRKGHLKAHITVKHVNKKDINLLKCVNCPYKTTLKKYLRYHILRKHTDCIECPQCDFKCKQKSTLNDHNALKHRYLTNHEGMF